MTRLAASLRPIARTAAAGGADEDDAGGRARIERNAGLSDRNPYPGCTASAPDAVAAASTRIDVQVALRCGRRAESPRLAGYGDVQRVPVRIRVDRDGADAEPVRGAHHPAGDLAAVGNEELAEHQRRPPRAGGGLRSVGRITCGTRRSASPRSARSVWRRGRGRAPRGCGRGGRYRRPTAGRWRRAGAPRARTARRWDA